MSATSQMPQFLQVLYGTVIGVSSFKMIESFSAVYPHLSSTVNTHDAIQPGLFFLRMVLLFSTILIAAHDWFTYHKNETPTPLKEKFWWNVPQIFSLVFISQMMLAAVNGDTTFWYIGALLYTICNCINMFSIIRYISSEMKTVLWTSYSIHFIITLLSILILNKHKNTDKLGLHFIIVTLTMIIVFVLWEIKERVVKNQKGKTNERIAHEDKADKIHEDESTRNKTGLTCKKLLTALNEFEHRDIVKKRKMILLCTLGFILSLIIILVISMINHLLFDTIFEVFCSAGFLGTAATGIYIILTDDEVSSRNAEIHDGIIDSMDENILVDKEFFNKITSDKFDKLMKETTKNPLRL